MGSFIDRDIARLKMNEDEIFVCMYVFQNNLLNISFFKKVDNGYDELLKHDVTKEYGKELVRKVRANEVEKITAFELKEFNQFIDKHNFFISRDIKDMMNKLLNELKVDYIGEMAGLHYVVASHTKRPIKQVFLLQQAKGENPFEVGRVPTTFVELVLLDYVHHVKIGEKTVFLMISESEFIGLKRSKKNKKIINVIKIDALPDSVSATKAYMITKKNNYEYTLLPFEKSTPKLMESLKSEGEKITKEFIDIMNITE